AVDRHIEEGLEVVVWKSKPAAEKYAPLARPISANDQEFRRSGNPRGAWKECLNRSPVRGRRDTYDARLLQIPLAWRCQCSCAQNAKQRFRHRIGPVASTYRAFIHLSERVGARKIRRDFHRFAKAALNGAG